MQNWLNDDVNLNTETFSTLYQRLEEFSSIEESSIVSIPSIFNRTVNNNESASSINESYDVISINESNNSNNSEFASSMNESYDIIEMTEEEMIAKIYKSDISSFIYDLYNYIINIDYNNIYSILSSPDYPIIKIVAIIVLSCTTFILLAWLRIFFYLINDRLLEHYKIKEKYPKIYFYINISRKISYIHILFTILCMLFFYIMIYSLCLHIMMVF